MIVNGDVCGGGGGDASSGPSAGHTWCDEREPLTVTVTRLEAVHLQLLRLGQPGLGQPLANVLALVTLKLQHLAVLSVLHYRSVARKFLGRDIRLS